MPNPDDDLKRRLAGKTPPPVQAEGALPWAAPPVAGAQPEREQSNTQDDMTPLALGGRRDWVATAKVATKVTPLVAAALMALWQFALQPIVRDMIKLRTEAAQAAATHDSRIPAEAGYQALKHGLEAQQQEIAELKAQRAAEGKKPARGHRSQPKAAPASPKLPNDLAEAEKVIKRATVAAAQQQAAPARLDAGAPAGQ